MRPLLHPLVAALLCGCSFNLQDIEANRTDPDEGEPIRPTRVVAGAARMQSEGHRLRVTATAPAVGGKVMRSDNYTVRLSR